MTYLKLNFTMGGNQESTKDWKSIKQIVVMPIFNL